MKKRKTLKLQGKNILLISPEPWHHIFVSKHHYAIHLAQRGNRVFFLNPPSTESSCIETEHENVYSVNYLGFFKGIRFFPSYLRKILIKNKFDLLQNLCESRFDVVWSFDNSVFFDFSALPSSVYCISHIVDLNQNFEFDKAAKSADLCIGLILKIVDKLKKYNSNTMQLTHGVKPFDTRIEKIKLCGKNKYSALYAGNLNMVHIDWRLILQVVLNSKDDIDFIFIGDNHDIFENSYKIKVSEQDNVFFKPKVKTKELYQHLNSADILFLAYLPSYDNDCALPHKLFEYLQTGHITISNWINSYEGIISQIDILCADNNEEYLKNFKRALEILKTGKKLINHDKNYNFVVSNTYENQINKIENFISQ